MTTRRDENNVWVSIGRGENVYKETTKTPVSDKQAYEECEHKKRERDKEGCRLKPIILKTPEGLYVCEIPVENEPEDGASDRTCWIWAACGVGASPVEAYDNWVKDWEDKV